MFTWMDVMEQEERRRDMLAQAENHRLTRELARRGESPSVRFYHRALTYVGKRLEHWGCRLQARYDPLVLNRRQRESLLSSQSTCGRTA